MTSGPTSPSAHHHLPSRTCHVQAPELRECFPTLIPGMGGVVAVHAGFHKVLRWEAPGGVLLVLPHLISCCGSTAGKGQRRRLPPAHTRWAPGPGPRPANTRFEGPRTANTRFDPGAPHHPRSPGTVFGHTRHTRHIRHARPALGHQVRLCPSPRAGLGS